MTARASTRAAVRNTSASRKKKTITPPGRPRRRRNVHDGVLGTGDSQMTGCTTATMPTSSTRRDDQRPHEQLDVALADVAPAALVDARGGEDHDVAEHHPRPGRDQQPVVLERDAAHLALEAEPERQVVRERDQRRVDHQLRQRVAMQRKGRRAKPSAHQRIVGSGAAPSRSATSTPGRGARASPAPRSRLRSSICSGRASRRMPPGGDQRARRRRPSRPSNVVQTGVPSATASRFIVPPALITRSACAISDCASIACAGTMKPPAASSSARWDVDARQHDRLGAAHALEHGREQLVLEAVVERDRRRRAHDDDRLARVERRARRAPPPRARSPPGSTPP